MQFIKEENRIYAANSNNETIAEVTFYEIENGVYNIDHTFVDNSLRGQGIGSKLYEALEEELKSRGVINLNACIAWIETPNSHLTHQSPDFHSKMGYKRVAHFHRCGYKFDEWYDMIWMEKLLDVKYFK